MIFTNMLKMQERETYYVNIINESKIFQCILFYEFYLSKFLNNSTAVKYTVWNIYPTLYQMMKTGCHV